MDRPIRHLGTRAIGCAACAVLNVLFLVGCRTSSQPVVVSVDCSSIEKAKTVMGLRNTSLAELGDVIELDPKLFVGRRVTSINPFDDEAAHTKYRHPEFLRVTNSVKDQEISLTSQVKLNISAAAKLANIETIKTDLQNQLTANTFFLVSEYYKTYIQDPVSVLNADDNMRKNWGPVIASHRKDRHYVIVGDVIWAKGVTIKLDDTAVKSAIAEYGKVANLNVSLTNSCSSNLKVTSDLGAAFFIKPYPIDFDMLSRKFVQAEGVSADDIDFDKYQLVLGSNRLISIEGRAFLAAK